ncbi:hypothetical protein, partial [Guyparkeria sp. SB14A]|uniref:hypothetical protein n=1 Tax=Guyparkeria sp. SB14A TaxID=2571147 RepID=UPI00145DF7D8
RQFTAGGVLHRMVFTNALPETDFDRIASDVARICETEIELFDARRSTSTCSWSRSTSRGLAGSSTATRLP